MFSGLVTFSDDPESGDCKLSHIHMYVFVMVSIRPCWPCPCLSALCWRAVRDGAVLLTELADGVWSPLSSQQTRRLVKVVTQLVHDYPTVGADSKNTQVTRLSRQRSPQTGQAG